MASRAKTLYTGITNNLELRVQQHKNKTIEGFTKLVFYEETDNVSQAIVREKQIKGWLRIKKIALIEKMNSDWNNLSEVWYSDLADIK